MHRNHPLRRAFRIQPRSCFEEKISAWLNTRAVRAVRLHVLRLATSASLPKVVCVKNSPLIFCALLLASVVRLSAQVTVEVLTDQDEFLPGEAIPVITRITNRSGQTLTFGRGQGWLRFSLQAHDGYVAMNGEVPVTDEFTLESSEHANVRVNIAPYFQLEKTGHYTVTATVTVPEWKRQISSNPKSFDVIQGARLWEQEFGVPKAPGDTNTVPEMRRYALQQANYLRSRIILYVQVTDASGKINKVLPVGPMISFGQPEPQVDRLSNLHVLYQNGPRMFSYIEVNPDGEMIKRQTYDYTTRPRLMADADGNITVVGGTRRITHDDIPTPKLSAGNDVSAPTNP